mmetsp:Transcript_6001/g.10293  ORF Transcript_6001/g.10293 Transcript_6001/m.10293 type:complete len:160 (-) Transcript_6001:317-796(-)|eukprot:CAMPEP_0196665198 /NCGR_PEP_ID=MMETSP1086-20130531/59980_1 /TAXON_ID=77921 /ORGANISM="Cyanoptyche  gloeocystis , Strain SAG4.97" /LENGTH=159 /DNA_ID=CAMNT_0042001829 /DNA_START=49 /DNA_END=528 /DNA_ORIENTATION=+
MAEETSAGDQQSFSDNQTQDFREVFDVIDQDKDGRIGLKDAGMFLRACSFNPTEAEVAELVKDLTEKGHAETVEFGDLVAAMQRRPTFTSYTVEDIQDAFRLFDRYGVGWLNVVEVKHIMTNLGEKLSDEELVDMLKDADPTNEGRVHYMDYITNMISR